MPKFKLSDIALDVSAMLFQRQGCEFDTERHVYVAGELDRDEFSKRYDADLKHDYLQCKPLNMDDWGDRFWLAGVVVSNTGGPMALIRANSMEEAIDVLTEDFKCCQLSEEEIAEMEAEGRGDEVRYNDGGTAYTSDNMHCEEVKLVRIDL